MENIADGYAYRFQLPAGEYSVLASTDIDRDGILCEAEDICGRFPVNNDPEPIQIRAGETRSGIDFLVRPRESAKQPLPDGLAVPPLLLKGLAVELPSRAQP